MQYVFFLYTKSIILNRATTYALSTLGSNVAWRRKHTQIAYDNTGSVRGNETAYCQHTLQRFPPPQQLRSSELHDQRSSHI